MRPIASDQNLLRCPLNLLLGTEAQVRLLRVLSAEITESLTAPDIAKRSGLTVPGARKALGRLLNSGFVVRVGGGRKHQYKLRQSDQLVKALAMLFQIERDRYEALLGDVKAEIGKLVPHAFAAWIQNFPKDFDDPLLIGVLHETGQLADYAEKLQERFQPIETDFDLTIEVVGYTKADLPELEFDAVYPLYGVLPFAEKLSREVYAMHGSHSDKDQQMMELSHRLAEEIQYDASLVRKAREHSRRLLKSEQGPATKDIKEWLHILETYSIRRLTRFLTSTSERACRLRQSNPILAILSADERSRILARKGRNR
jgi:predicted transcriptional regulator